VPTCDTRPELCRHRDGTGHFGSNGIGQPEAGTLEARLTAVPGPARLIPTHQGQGLATSAIAALPIRSGSMKNRTYFALTPQSVTDFDWLAVLDSTVYAHGGPPLPEGDAHPMQ
jgi:erythromycin esterase